MLSAELVVAPAHPSLAGHFPGDAIVPGVVLLETVSVATAPSKSILRGVPHVKFLAPLRPGQKFYIEYELVNRLANGLADSQRIKFSCYTVDQDVLFARGVLEFALA